MIQTVLLVIYNNQICKKCTITLLFIILNIYLVINLSMVCLTRFSVTQAYTALNGRIRGKKGTGKNVEGSGHGLIWRINPESEWD
jgi:hypothetical protein